MVPAVCEGGISVSPPQLSPFPVLGSEAHLALRNLIEFWY